MEHTKPQLRCEVVYARPDRQYVVALTLPAGATVADAVKASGLMGSFAELRQEPPALGVFGRVVRPDEALRDGDRVELYRPLKADPRATRRARAAKAGR